MIEDNDAIIHEYSRRLMERVGSSYHYVFVPNKKAMEKAYQIARSSGRLHFVVMNGNLRGIAIELRMGRDHEIIYKNRDDRFNSPEEVVGTVAKMLEPQVFDRDGKPVFRAHENELKTPELPPLLSAEGASEDNVETKGARLAEGNSRNITEKAYNLYYFARELFKGITIEQALFTIAAIVFLPQLSLPIYAAANLHEITHFAVAKWIQTRPDSPIRELFIHLAPHSVQIVPRNEFSLSL